jgi:hypothetical protein
MNDETGKQPAPEKTTGARTRQACIPLPPPPINCRQCRPRALQTAMTGPKRTHTKEASMGIATNPTVIRCVDDIAQGCLLRAGRGGNVPLHASDPVGMRLQAPLRATQSITPA